MIEYEDRLMGFVEWTPNRNVLVFRREHSDRSFVRMRVFNRHLERGFWYPSPRSFHVNENCAEDLGQVIIAAARDKSLDPPDWWNAFERQYKPNGHPAAKWKREPAVR